MVAFCPDRYGHLVFTDRANLEQILTQQRRPIELCLSSNLLTTGHDSLDAHHIHQLEFHAEDYLAAHGCLSSVHSPTKVDRSWISINTDDRGVFNTTLARELEILLSHRAVLACGIERTQRETEEQLKLMTLWCLERQAILNSFLPEKHKAEALRYFDEVAEFSQSQT
jgi:adenosine deaminase